MEFTLSLLVNSNLTKIKGSRRDFLLACPIALAAATACSVLPNRWFAPHFAVYAEFALSSWDAIVERARIHSHLWLACWLNCPDRSRSSQSHEVREYLGCLHSRGWLCTLSQVRERLFHLCNSPDVDSSWLLWSREAEASLARAYLSGGGPPLSNPGSYVGRGSLSICTMRSGGRCHDRIYHVDRADEFDVTHSGIFPELFSCTCSSLSDAASSLCVMYLRVLSYMAFQRPGLLLYGIVGGAVVRLGPTGLVTSFDPWTHWIPPDLHGFCQVGYGHFGSSQ